MVSAMQPSPDWAVLPNTEKIYTKVGIKYKIYKAPTGEASDPTATQLRGLCILGDSSPSSEL